MSTVSRRTLLKATPGLALAVAAPGVFGAVKPTAAIPEATTKVNPMPATATLAPSPVIVSDTAVPPTFLGWAEQAPLEVLECLDRLLDTSLDMQEGAPRGIMQHFHATASAETRAWLREHGRAWRDAAPWLRQSTYVAGRTVAQ